MSEIRIFVFTFFMTFFWVAAAQTYEVGVFLGGANAMSDVGSQQQINPNTIAFGGLFKWNKSQRYAWRAQLSYASLDFSDADATDPSRIARGLKASNQLLEVSAGLEVNFFPYNLHRLEPAFTPYLYTGITAFGYDYFYFNNAMAQDINKKAASFALPLIFGAKARIGANTLLGIEIGVRYTFTDNLDGSHPINSNFAVYSFGDINNNDWYVFSGVTLTYTFTRKPCSDCFN